MLTGLTYEEEVKVEKQISQETAETVVQELQKTGIIDDCGVINKEVAVETINLSSVPEPVKKEIIETIRQEKPVTVASLSKTTYTETKVEKVSVSYEEAVQIMEDLKGTQVIDSKGKIKDTMKAELAAGTLNLSDRWSKAKQRAVLQALNKADNKPVIRDASKEVTVKRKSAALNSQEFKELWNKIKQKNTYRVQFDLDTLVANSIKEIKEMPEIGTARLLSQTASVNIEKSGISHQAGRTFIQDLTRNYETLPDILRLISTKTLLKRSTVNRILQASGRITLTSILAKGIFSEIECATEGEIHLEIGTEPCQISMYNVELRRKGKFLKSYDVLTGKTEDGKILTQEECAKNLSQPIKSVENKDRERSYWLANSSFSDRLPASLEDELKNNYIKQQEGAFNTDIDIIKMRSSRQKAVLEQTLETLRQETSKIKESIGSAKDRLEELKIQKRINEKEKQLRKKEEGLFFEQMRIEAIAEEQIEQLCATNNIEIKLSLVFKVKI